MCAGNIIWLPSQNEWALIDFGCAAQHGSAADLSFSLYYAPPEVVSAFQAGNATVRANPAMDVWALGVRTAPMTRKSNVTAMQCCSCSGCSVVFSAMLVKECVHVARLAMLLASMALHVASWPVSAQFLRPFSTVWQTSANMQIMAWELLTQSKFYGPDADMQTLIDTLTGTQPLPSELPLSPRVRRGLGNRAYRDSIMCMLSRDPAARPPVAEVARRWAAVFQQTTLTTEAEV